MPNPFSSLPRAVPGTATVPQSAPQSAPAGGAACSTAAPARLGASFFSRQAAAAPAAVPGPVAAAAVPAQVPATVALTQVVQAAPPTAQAAGAVQTVAARSVRLGVLVPTGSESTMLERKMAELLSGVFGTIATSPDGVERVEVDPGLMQIPLIASAVRQGDLLRNFESFMVDGDIATAMRATLTHHLEKEWGRKYESLLVPGAPAASAISGSSAAAAVVRGTLQHESEAVMGACKPTIGMYRTIARAVNDDFGAEPNDLHLCATVRRNLLTQGVDADDGNDREGMDDGDDGSYDYTRIEPTAEHRLATLVAALPPCNPAAERDMRAQYNLGPEVSLQATDPELAYRQARAVIEGASSAAVAYLLRPLDPTTTEVIGAELILLPLMGAVPDPGPAGVGKLRVSYPCAVKVYASTPEQALRIGMQLPPSIMQTVVAQGPVEGPQSVKVVVEDQAAAVLSNLFPGAAEHFAQLQAPPVAEADVAGGEPGDAPRG